MDSDEIIASRIIKARKFILVFGLNNKSVNTHRFRISSVDGYSGSAVKPLSMTIYIKGGYEFDIHFPTKGSRDAAMKILDLHIADAGDLAPPEYDNFEEEFEDEI